MIDTTDIRQRLSNNTSIDAKEIKALCDEVEANQWVSVDDRLPEKMGFYLISNGVYVKRVEYNPRYKGWFDVTRVSGVTYWKPLPKPPVNTELNGD